MNRYPLPPAKVQAYADTNGIPPTAADDRWSCCPWCGMCGLDFDESPPPSDYCGHDPALCEPRQSSNYAGEGM